MIATTGLEPTKQTLEHAKHLACRLNIPLVQRRDLSLEKIRECYQADEILVVSAKGARVEARGRQPFFFHPNTAAFRIKRLERGDTDTMLSACQIRPGDAVLDATLGLGADSIVFAHAVGKNGRVVGVESQKVIAILVEDGFRHWKDASDALVKAMKRVEVIAEHHLEVLRKLPDRSFDVVYFDPMFVSGVAASTGIASLRSYANEEELSAETVAEALRVAKRRVVLKEGQTGTLHEKFGFTPYRKKEHQVVYSYRETAGGE